jgi:hypothetical protein
MTSPPPSRPPISTRHALALAFDLAVRRDALHSIVIPLALRAPWVLTWVMLPPEETGAFHPRDLALRSFALVGDFVTSLVIGAMLRFRARSVYNTSRATPPASAYECYMGGLRRIPWLITTEIARNTSFALAASFSVLPAAFLRLAWPLRIEDLPHDLLLLAVAFVLALPSLMLAFRLAVATEAVVLDDHDLAGAFQHSFRIMRGRFERWLELIVASGLLILGLALCVAALTLAVPISTAVVILWVAIVAIMPIIQYCWTFFYLRLVEVEPRPVVSEVGPAYAAVPRPAPDEISQKN